MAPDGEQSRFVPARGGHVSFEVNVERARRANSVFMYQTTANLHQQLIEYACALRTHSLEDTAVKNRLIAIGLTSDESAQIVAKMDEMNWTAGSNSRPTAVGWLSILVAIVSTALSAFYLGRAFAIPFGFVQVVFVLPFVAIGFLAHIGFSKLLEMAGIQTSIAQPIPIPDEEQLTQILSEARALNRSQSEDA